MLYIVNESEGTGVKFIDLFYHVEWWTGMLAN